MNDGDLFGGFLNKEADIDTGRSVGLGQTAYRNSEQEQLVVGMWTTSFAVAVNLFVCAIVAVPTQNDVVKSFQAAVHQQVFY